MMKMEKEYEETYGCVPRDKMDRLYWALDQLNYKGRGDANVTATITRCSKLKWNSLKYTIWILPKGTPRPRSGRSGVFYVKGAKDNKVMFEKFLREHEDQLPYITTPCKFNAKAYFPIPKNMPKYEQIACELGFGYPLVKPDWDNVAKAYCDMIQDYLLYDDCLIIDGRLRKRYSFKPRIEIELKWLEDYDLEYNRKKIEGKSPSRK